jgi:hypothetical protein
MSAPGKQASPNRPRHWQRQNKPQVPVGYFTNGVNRQSSLF